MATQIVFFCSHKPNSSNKYNQHVFSQWFGCAFYEEVDALNEMGNNYKKRIYYNCAEQYMMAQKAIAFISVNHMNEDILKKIMESSDPDTIKKLGKQVHNYDPKIWDKIKDNVVIRGNMLKFGQNPKLLEILLNTCDQELVEAAWYDRVWGIGYRAEEAMTVPREKWGENRLGKALQEVRSRLRKLSNIK